MEAIKNADLCQNNNNNSNQPQPTPIMPGNEKYSAKAKSEGDALNGRYMPRPRVFSPSEIATMDETIGNAIAHANKHYAFSIGSSAARLLQDGTPDQKYEFVRITEGSDYRFPENLNRSASTRCGCIRWGTIQNCIDKNECKTVCTAGQVTCHIASYVAGTPQWVCGAGAAVCNLVCAVVPICTSTPVCLQMSADCEPAHG